MPRGRDRDFKTRDFNFTTSFPSLPCGRRKDVNGRLHSFWRAWVMQSHTCKATSYLRMPPHRP